MDFNSKFYKYSAVFQKAKGRLLINALKAHAHNVYHSESNVS